MAVEGKPISNLSAADVRDLVLGEPGSFCALTILPGKSQEFETKLQTIESMESTPGAHGRSNYDARLTGISQGFQRPEIGRDSPGTMDSISEQHFVVQAELGFATEGAGRWILPSPSVAKSGGGHGASPPSISPSAPTVWPQASMPVSMLLPSHCFYCGALPSSTRKDGSKFRFRRCARCRSVDYCSEKCQRKHWKECHKSECSLLEGRVAREAKKHTRDHQPNAVGGFMPSVHRSASARPNIYSVAEDSPQKVTNLPSRLAPPSVNVSRTDDRDRNLNTLPPRARCV